MKKKFIPSVAVLVCCISLTSCGGEPESDQTLPETTQQDNINNLEFDPDSIELDTVRIDNTAVDNVKTEKY